MTRIGDLPTSGIDNADGLIEMADFAQRFLGGHKWVRAIKEGYLDRGIAPMLAVFYFEIDPIEADDAVWVIAGDIPPAYIDGQSAPGGDIALRIYVDAMKHWAATVRSGGSVDGLIPVTYARSTTPLPITVETAGLLERFMKSIEDDLIPWFTEGRWELEGE